MLTFGLKMGRMIMYLYLRGFMYRKMGENCKKKVKMLPFLWWGEGTRWKIGVWGRLFPVACIYFAFVFETCNSITLSKTKLKLSLKNDSVVFYILTIEIAHRMLFNGKKKDYRTVNVLTFLLEKRLCVQSSMWKVLSALFTIVFPESTIHSSSSICIEQASKWMHEWMNTRQRRCIEGHITKLWTVVDFRGGFMRDFYFLHFRVRWKF